MTRPAPFPAARGRAGMTLIEVILAIAILGVCIAGILSGMGACLGVYDASSFVLQACNVLSRGEAEHPLVVEDDPEEDLAVSEDSSIVDGWTWERTVEAKEDEADADGLYLVTTTVRKGRESFSVPRLVYWPEGIGKTGSGGGP